jgi:endonuclease/exonuclease/phosphatase family metal-dependent hydrolase
VLGLTLFAYQVHYDTPLPVDNRWLLVAAVVVLGLAGLATEPVAATRRASHRTLAVVTGACIVAGAVFVAGIALGEPDLTSDRAGTSIRVATFKVHNGVTRDGQVDLEAIARHVEAIDPDVLVIEEADRGWLLAGTTDVAEWLKRRLGMAYAWAPAADEQMGNLVFHRIPLRDAEVVSLPMGAGTMDRSALVARVGPVAGRDMTVIGVHFQNGSSPADKDTRIREADVLLDAWGGAPRTVLLGDFNMDPGERDLRHVLAAGFSSTQPTDRCTLTTSNENCVDWILVTDDLVQGPPRVLRVSDFDHNPVATTVRPR